MRYTLIAKIIPVVFEIFFKLKSTVTNLSDLK